MKKYKVYYIVLTDCSVLKGDMRACTMQGNILWRSYSNRRNYSHIAHGFKTKQQAKNAVARTKRYQNKRSWSYKQQFEIIPVKIFI